MTKMQVVLRLERPLDNLLLTRIAEAHTLYGIQKITVAPALDSIMVEYDATRLRPAEVESAMMSAGIPVAPALA